MLFGSGASLSGMFATHPPLIERIQALKPGFSAANYPVMDPRQRRHTHEADQGGDSRTKGFAGDVTTAFASGGSTVSNDEIAETVGHPDNEHIQFARELRRSIPESLYDAAHSAEFAYLLTVALILARSGKTVARQLRLVQEQLGAERARILQRYYEELSEIGAEYRLPLLEIAFPALKLRPTQELAYLVSLTSRLIEIDGEVELYEYCFYRIMMSNLGQAIDPSGRRAPRRSRRNDLQAAATNLLRILADYGHESDDERSAAFRAGLATLGPWAQDSDFESNRPSTVKDLDHSLDVLLGLNSKGQESLLRAISATAAHDGKLTITEAELIRAVCATLNYPLPPILVHRQGL